MSRPSESSEQNAGSGTDEAETRTVQRVGGSTYTVSLLKPWAEEQGIGAGTEVYLRPHVDGSLVIRAGPESVEEEAEVSVPVDDLATDNLARTVHAMYVAGYDTIRFLAADGLDEADRRTIADTTSALIGTDIVETGEDRVVVQSLLDPEEVSVYQSLVQLQRVTLAMHEDATAALLEGSVLPRRVIDRDDEADRLFAMVARYFQRGLADLSVLDDLSLDRATLFKYYTAARQLERVADHAEKIATIAGESDGPVDGPGTDSLAGAASKTRGVVADAMAALLGRTEVEATYGALEARDALIRELEALDRSYYESDETDDYRLSLVIDSLIRTAEYGGNIAEAAIATMPQTEEQ